MTPQYYGDGVDGAPNGITVTHAYFSNLSLLGCEFSADAEGKTRAALLRGDRQKQGNMHGVDPEVETRIKG
jgi:hypothetical protein